MLSGTLEGGKRRPLGIIIGFVITFALFTLFARSLVQNLGINLDWLRIAAFGFIILFGLILCSDYLSLKFEIFTQKIANLGSHASGRMNSDGFISGLFLGGLISLIWVPCAGPILATAIIQTAIQKTSFQSFMTFLSFALGSAIPMLLIAFIGRRILLYFAPFKRHAAMIRKIFGIIIIVGAVIAAMMANVNLYSNPEAAGTETNINLQKNSNENKNIRIKESTNGNEHEKINANTKTNTDKLIDKLIKTYPAPEFREISAWINSKPLNMAALKGKVVLIDFWTYSCINCIRTLPYLKEWYKKYHADGFEIIGIHTPEFEFEKKLSNVEMAVKKNEIPYPVALDNNYGTWLSFNNRYWPAHYLIDKNGNVVFEHFGEGNYQETEQNIRVLLGLKENTEGLEKRNTEFSFLETPETYLGYRRTTHFQSTEKIQEDVSAQYSDPKNLEKDHWALQGKWNIQAEKVVSEEAGNQLKLHFYARKVFLVMGTVNDQPADVKVLLDGKPIGNSAGSAVRNNKITVKNHTLYEIVNLPSAGSHILTLITSAPNVEFYAFTFGG